MKAKSVIPRELVSRNVNAEIDHYFEGDAQLPALGFISALEQAYGHISHPATGSPRYAHELGLPGLRSWPLTRYPYLIFYIECDESIDVWRVLHEQRDIPAWLGANTAEDDSH
jgi:toxin ParE1/3/4